MAVVGGTTETFDLSNIAEDVESVIKNISPMETWMFSNLKRKKAENVYHE